MCFDKMLYNTIASNSFETFSSDILELQESFYEW
jgi:hypothetical protein